MSQIGTTALWIAVAAGGLSVAAGTFRARVAPVATLVSSLSASAALGALVWAFVREDFGLTVVVDHSRRGLSVVERVSGLWGGMAGSLLLFGTGMSIVSVIAVMRAPARLRAQMAAIGGGVSTSLLAMSLVLADPFERLDAPTTNGIGLTPILEHPAMSYHPPLLYAGLTSLLAPFALLMAAVVARRIDRDVLTLARRWLTVSWTLLAVGMLSGAHWAYVELGWGGYWAWDPVENTALLPWLAVTAALHGLLRDTDRPNVSTPISIASTVVFAFIASTFGGLLSRSGATSSVHAFAEARSIGRAFALLCVVLAVGAVLAFGRLRHVRDERRRELGINRATALAGHQIVLLSAFAVVLIGSAWPLVAASAGGDGLAIEGRFFARFTGPLAIVGLALMAIGPHVGRRDRRPAIGAAIGGVSGLVLVGLLQHSSAFVAVLGTLAGITIGTSFIGLARASNARAGHLAHLGVAVLLLGVAGTATGSSVTRTLADNESFSIAGVDITNKGVTVLERDGGREQVVVAAIAADDITLRPELVAHRERNVLLAETALHSAPTRDLQISLRSADDDGRVLIEVGVHPLQQLVWWGALLLIAAGPVSLVETRSRSRAAQPRRRPLVDVDG